jgi:fatty-acyl-CoA synthase
MINLSSFIRFHAEKDPESVAYTYDGARISYREFFGRIERLGGWLMAQGIKPGDIVAILMKNSSAFLEITFAASHIGAVFLPINYRLSGEEVGYIVGHSGADILFVDEELQSVAGDKCRVIVVDHAAQGHLALLAGDVAPAAMAHRDPADLLRLMYTSGTTARPKGVMHSYENFYWKSAAHVIELGLDRSTRLLTVQPLYHVGAFDLPGMAVLWCGGTIVLQRDFDVDAALSAIESERVTGTTLVPVLTGSLLGHPERSRYDVSSLRWVVGGGEKTPESRIRAFSEYFINARYIDAYGLTESGSGDSFMEAGREIEKIGSAGRATLHVAIEIKDEEGRTLPVGTEGEICLRGPKVTRGYWNDPEKTRESFFGEWFRTGDVGRLDDDGFLYLTDRLKDMIKSGGENIASSEVERVLYELPHIKEAAVVGLPDPKWGEKPVAVVVLAPGQALDLPALAQYCRSRLAGFKIPKELFVVESLPRNATGKILKRELRSMLKDHVEHV